MDSWDELLTEEQKKKVRVQFGKIIRTLRKMRCKTIKYVADEIRIKHQHLSRMERGLRNPPEKEAIHRLAATFGIVRGSLLLKAAAYERKPNNQPFSKKEIRQLLKKEINEFIDEVIKKFFD